MLPRAAASRRTALALLTTTPRLATRHTAPLARSISFWPLRKKPDPNLPVYFPRPPTPPRRFPWRKVRYAVFTLMVYYALWQVYMSVVLDPLLDWAEAEWDSLSEKEKKDLEEQADDEEEDPILFLPFPFTTKKVPQPPYKGSDPEWQEFVKVNKDPKKQKEIKSNLAEAVRRRVEANPAVTRLMGGKSTKVRKIWLDIIYPPAPPPKHYISGLIVDYDGLFWGDRLIEPAAANQLDAIMYPKAVAMAAWTFWNVLIQQSKEDISRALGLSGSREQETSWQSVMIDRGKEKSSLGSPSGKPVQGTIFAPPNPQAKASQPGSIQGAPDFAGLFRKPGDPEAPMGTASGSVLLAFQAASLALAKNWRPAEQLVNRGCIRVDGLVELQGRSGIMVVYVLGWYDPQARKYVNVQTKLKHLVQSKQRPLGGN